MKVLVIGAAGKSGEALVNEALAGQTSCLLNSLRPTLRS
jgi:nucleoside-diphosphate-sugar epimerase